MRLGLRANVAQFALLVAVNALVGGMLGQERTVLPLLAEQEFRLTAYTAALTYILAFGVATLTAFCKAERTTLVGSTTPKSNMSPYLSLRAS